MLSRLFIDLQEKYGAAITPQDIIDHSAIASLAEFISSHTGAGKKKSVLGQYKGIRIKSKTEQIPAESGHPYVVEHFLKSRIIKTSSGRDLEVFTGGPDKGDPVIFLTALSFTCGIWEFQIAEFQDKYKLVFPHLPGHGKSKTYNKAFSFEDISDDLIQMLDHLEIDSAHFVGWCMAGNIGQLFAHRHQERIKTLNLVCTTPTDARLRGLTSDDLKDYSDSPLYTYHIEFQNIFQNSSFKQESIDFYQNFVAKNYCSVDTTAVMHYIDNLFRFDSTRYLKDIRVPTQIIAGKWDIAFPTDQVRLLQKGIKNSLFHELKSAGHMPFLTQHDFFNHIMDSFWQKQTPR